MTMVNQIFTSRGYISLDFLRGLAAWSVALPHFYMFSGNGSEVLDFTTVFAVEVFFILSGFVLGKQLDTCFERANYRTLKTFYVRRWLRTIPIFIFVLVLISAINQNLFTLRFFEYATFTATWLSIPNLDEYFVPAWSLAVEEWFYLLFPITLALSARYGWSKSFTIFSFLGLFAVVKLLHAVNDPEYIESLRRITVLRLDSIAVGYCLHIFNKKYNFYLSSKNILFLFLSIILILLSYYFYIGKNALAFIYISNLAAAASLLTFLYSERIFERSQFIKFLAAFGAHTSYCTYLCHLLIYQVVNGAILGDAAKLYLYLLGIVCFSVASFFVVERPFQSARPNYDTEPNSVVDKSFLRSFPVKAVCNIAVLILLLFAAEAGARMAEKIYGSLYISQRIPGGNEVSVNPAKDESSLVDAHQRDKADRDSMPGSAYRYSSYSVFKNRAFSSDTINIDKKGFRIHPLPEQTDSGEIFRIWVFGASPVFGATNTDLWTIPARLQFHMSEQFYGRPVIVRNMAVAGYTSWQTLLTLQKAIGETKTPPNAVVVFTLRNDLSTAYHQPEPGCRHLMYTGVGSHSALERSWENLSRGNYIFLQDILNNFKAKFTGVSEISRLIWKATSVVESNFNPELMIERYRKEKKKYNSLVAECMPIALNHFRNNISLMADLAKRHNALFFAGSLPELAVTKKQLAGNEVVENYLTENYFFALPEDELNNLDQLPRSRYKQRYLADKQTYLDNVNRFEISLRGISNSANANYIHLGEFSDQLGDDIQLFATSIHFTNEGADLLAQEITRQVASKLPPVNLIKERGN